MGIDGPQSVVDLPFSDYKKRILKGRLDVRCPPVVKMVRIFTSSTFTDTKLERNAWMKNSYPFLQEECEKRGYDFQVVDMRWGIRKEMESVHATEDLCLSEIKNCDELSTGPSFVTLYAQKYGWCPYPTTISKEHYGILTKTLSEEEKRLIDRWYKLDENNVPAHYAILPKTKHYPDYTSKNCKKQKEASAKCNEECDKFANIIAREASKHNGEDMEKYTISVTEKEIHKGILEKSEAQIKEQCLWVYRHITDLENSKDENARYYKDMSDEKQRLLAKLKDKKMRKVLPKENIIEEKVDWLTATKSSSSNHKSYIERFCKKFSEKLLDMIDKGIEKRKTNSDPLLAEISCHVVHCQKLSREFWQRQKLVQCVKTYIYEENVKPLNLYGVKGTGKSFLAAKIVQDLQADKKLIVIYRFCTLTEESQKATTTFYNIYLQICQALGENEESVDKSNYGNICEELSAMLRKSKDKIVLILDSIDALQPPEESSNHAWMPQPLPENIKIILTTESKIGSSENWAHEEVPAFTAEELEGMLFHLLKLQHRTLSTTQTDFVCKILKKFPSSDMMKLTYDVVVKWTSNDGIQINDNVSGSDKVTGSNFPAVLNCKNTKEAFQQTLKNLFSELERKHGEELVKKTLSYLVIAERGLTEKELIDLLSDDEEVIQQVENGWWEIVDKKIPIAVLLRLLHDLNVALDTLVIDGVPVIAWRDKALKHNKQTTSLEPVGIEKIVRDLYLPNKGRTIRTGGVYLEKMASFFIGMKNKSLRKLNNLPWILTKLDVKRLKTECLCNFDFILSKIENVGVNSVIDDISWAVSVHGEKHMGDSIAIKQVLKLSQTALSNNVHQLPAQVLGRMSLPKTPTTELKKFFEKCENPGFTTLVPKPSILSPIKINFTCCLPVHGGTKVIDLLLTKDGKTAITAGEEDRRCQLQFWDVENEKPKSTLRPIGEKVWKIILTNDDKFVLVISKKEISVYNTSKMTFCSKYVFVEDPHYSDNTCPVVCLGGSDKIIIGIFWNDHYTAIPIKEGLITENEREIIHEKVAKMESNYKSGQKSLSAGSEEFMAWTDEEGILLRTYNLRKRGEVKARRMYDTFKQQSNYDERNSKDDASARIDAMCFTQDGCGIFISSKHFTDIRIINAEDYVCIGIIKGKGEYSPENLRLAPGNLLYFPSKRHVVVIDVNEKSSINLENHPSHLKVAAISLLPNKSYCVLTVADDGNLRFWKYDKFFNKDIPKTIPEIRSICFIPNDKRNCVMHSKSDGHDLIQIWDAEKNSAVRSIAFKEKSIAKIEMIGIFGSANEVHILLQHTCGKLFLMNLETPEICTQYKFERDILVKEGQKTFSYINKTKDILGIREDTKCLTRLYLTQEKKKEPCDILGYECISYLVNKEETILILETEIQILVYHLPFEPNNKNYKPFYEMDKEKRSKYNVCVSVSSKGDYYIQEKGEEFSIVNIKEDNTTKSKSPEIYTNNQFDIFEFYSGAFLPNGNLLCSFFDGSIRIISLEGKTIYTTKASKDEHFDIDGNEGSEFYLTHIHRNNEETIYIRENTSHNVVASFTSELVLKHVKMGPDGCSVWAGVQIPLCVARFQIKTDNEKPNSLQGKCYDAREETVLKYKFGESDTDED